MFDSLIVAGIFAFYAGMSAKIACVYSSVWAIRKKSEVDIPLSRNARALRWSVVLLAFLIAYEAPYKYLRVAAVYIGLAFLCWPNFAYHLNRLISKEPSARDEVPQ